MELFLNRKVLIFGLGLNGGGLGMARFLARRGAIVSVTDLKTKEELKQSLKQLEGYNIKYILGKHRIKDFKENDIIVQNPAITPNNKYLKIALQHNKKIIIELLYVIKHFPGKIIGITGTKGKSTTTLLIYHILKEHYKNSKTNVYVGGNLQSSTIDILEQAKKEDIAVLEIPSYQLNYLGKIKKSPEISVITNLYKDHINWHGSLKKYHTAKMNIFKYQSKKDYLIINSRELKKIQKKKIMSKVTITSIKKRKLIISNDYKKDIILNLDTKKIKLKGPHNLENIALSIATAKLLNIKDNTINKILESFTGLEGRQEYIAKIKGVYFFNDTTATNVYAVKATINRFKKKFNKKTILIMGGVDKNLEYKEIKEDLEKHVKKVILLKGTASIKINNVLNKKKIKVIGYFDNFKKAIEQAFKESSKGDAIILCPASASFNMFQNEFDRGKKFKKIVLDLAKKYESK